MSFATLVDRLRHVVIDGALRGSEKVDVELPADEALVQRLKERLGKELPSELLAFAQVTAGFSVSTRDGHVEVRLAEDEENDDDSGPREGDLLTIEPGEPVCRLWWRTDDPGSWTLVARSLLEYVERCADYFEDPLLFAPFQATARAPVLAARDIIVDDQDAGARTFIEGVRDDEVVCDLRDWQAPVALAWPEAALAAAAASDGKISPSGDCYVMEESVPLAGLTAAMVDGIMNELAAEADDLEEALTGADEF